MSQEIEIFAKNLGKSLQDYSVKEVADFVESIGLKSYAFDFRIVLLMVEKNGIDGQKLLDINELALEKKLGMQTKIHRTKLSKGIYIFMSIVHTCEHH